MCACTPKGQCSDHRFETQLEQSRARWELIPKIEKAEMPGGDQ